MILPFQGNSSPPDIPQQAELLLYEYKLHDKTLQKAQLEQHKMFQNFPTIPAPAVPSAPPPLVTGTKPKVPQFEDKMNLMTILLMLSMTLKPTILFLMTMISP